MSVGTFISAARVSTLCQYRALSPFVIFVGPSVFHRVNPDPSKEKNFSIDLRRFSTSSVLLENSSYQPSAKDSGLAVSKIQEKDRPIILDPEANQLSTVPWYLQVNNRNTATHVPKHEEIPDVPEDAPKNLGLILEQLSVEIGLDELKLIDLRNLDPPPALGSNLLMVIGTARSEKHLHVSADRFCRWLRSEYGMRPYADGLLGRNELKIKLRRKVKRTKLLGSTSKRLDTDDGIRSNWICVNVGPIETSRGTVQLSEEEGIVGFGGCDDGTQLVVQMMTEDKREEIDLEDLWSRVLDKHSSIQNKQPPEPSNQGAVHKNINLGVSHPRYILTDKMLTSHSPPVSCPGIHCRSFHDRPARKRIVTSRDPLLGLSGRAELSPYMESKSPHDNFGSLLSHLSSLESLPRKDALFALGQSACDKESTPFLSKFHGLIPAFPERRHWGAKLALIQYGINLGHKRYTTDDLINVLDEAHEAGSTLPSNSYSLVIQSIIDTTPKDFHEIKYTKHSSPLYKIIAVVEHMELRNIDIKSTQIMRNLYIAFEMTWLAEIESSRSLLHSLSAARLAQFFNDNTGLNPPLSLPILAMDQLAAGRRWHEFWNYWRQLPINLNRRPQVLYTAMFNYVARTGHKRMCVDALTEWIPNLPVERPPVEITADLAEAILACLRIADPHIEEDIKTESKQSGQWVRLFKRCLEGFDRPVEDTDKMQAQAERMYGDWRLPVLQV